MSIQVHDFFILNTLVSGLGLRYYKSMKKNPKSSITLPPRELEMVEKLVKSLGARSKVDVIRRGLYLLKSQSDRDALKLAYAEASRSARKSLRAETEELDDLSGEGIE